MATAGEPTSGRILPIEQFLKAGRPQRPVYAPKMALSSR